MVRGIVRGSVVLPGRPADLIRGGTAATLMRSGRYLLFAGVRSLYAGAAGGLLAPLGRVAAGLVWGEEVAALLGTPTLPLSSAARVPAVRPRN